MTSIGAKVEHVRAADQTRDHHCHWPGCSEQVPPAKWGCRRHWYMLPAAIRDAIWRTYRIGQERSQSPSREYVAAAHAAREFALEHDAVAAKAVTQLCLTLDQEPSP